MCVMLYYIIHKIALICDTTDFSQQNYPDVSDTFHTGSSYLHNIRFDRRWFDLLFRSFLGSRNSQVVLGCQTFKKFIDKSHRLCNDNKILIKRFNLSPELCAGSLNENCPLSMKCTNVPPESHYTKYFSAPGHAKYIQSLTLNE